MKKGSGLSLIDFIVSIADAIINPNGKQESPYDVNFTNHYIALHNFEESCGKMTNDFKIDQIVQDKKSKQIDVELNSSIKRDEMEHIKEYCDTNNIDYNISKGKLKSITITKNTKGVLEEREWKK